VANNTTTYYYKTTSTEVCFADLVSTTDISAIRVGVVYDGGDVVHISDELFYYNPVSIADFRNDVYIFDGYMNDHYITEFEELCNIVYYGFIYRYAELDIVFDSDYVSLLESKYGKTALYAMMEDINHAFDTYYETSYCYIDMSAEYDGSKYMATVYFDFFGVTECDTNVPMYWYNVQDVYDPYYELYEGVARVDSYYEFVSDDKYLYTYVNTSEELYWAVENGYVPMFNDTTSMAYIIYNKAKDVLRDIIYVEMSDYEKALAIFDWISLNTVYNHTTVDEYASLGYPIYSIQPSYYLEGVFINGYAVCDGFSKAYSLMCNMEGIECIRVVGTASSTGDKFGGHAWNKVIIDDEAYVVDITWTDWLSVQYHYDYGGYLYN
jgi:hypothetical protein